MSAIQDINACVIIPTYNNDKTLERVIKSVLEIVAAHEVIIVNDGSTDSTEEILKKLQINPDQIIINTPNQGKGTSLRKAFKKCLELGFDYAITIDSDGQHYAKDIPAFVAACKANPNAVIMGSRDMEETEGVPKKSSFGNKFSNFWFRVETTWKLPDTQTGYRLYPLKPISKINLYTSRFETEIEVIVKLAWYELDFVAIPIDVLYDAEERVSHFRPFKDFTRISILNTYLCTLAFLFYLPRMAFRSIKKKGLRQIFKEQIAKPNESSQTKALSIGFGFFMGIIPLWGFQLLIGIPLSIYFKMNKFLFIAAANISIPPMIPLIIFISYWFGSFFVSEPFEISRMFELDIDSIYLNIRQYIIGSILFAIVAFAVSYSISFLILNRKK